MLPYPDGRFGLSVVAAERFYAVNSEIEDIVKKIFFPLQVYARVGDCGDTVIPVYDSNNFIHCRVVDFCMAWFSL